MVPPSYDHFICGFIQILKKLAFISEQGTIELKGRVACELHTQEVLATELLFRNVLSGMEPAEIAALLSCIVFQQVKFKWEATHPCRKLSLSYALYDDSCVM